LTPGFVNSFWHDPTCASRKPPKQPARRPTRTPDALCVPCSASRTPPASRSAHRRTVCRLPAVATRGSALARCSRTGGATASGSRRVRESCPPRATSVVTSRSTPLGWDRRFREKRSPPEQAVAHGRAAVPDVAVQLAKDPPGRDLAQLGRRPPCPTRGTLRRALPGGRSTDPTGRWGGARPAPVRCDGEQQHARARRPRPRSASCAHIPTRLGSGDFDPRLASSAIRPAQGSPTGSPTRGPAVGAPAGAHARWAADWPHRRLRTPVALLAGTYDSFGAPALSPPNRLNLADALRAGTSPAARCPNTRVRRRAVASSAGWARSTYGSRCGARVEVP